MEGVLKWLFGNHVVRRALVVVAAAVGGALGGPDVGEALVGLLLALGL